MYSCIVSIFLYSISSNKYFKVSVTDPSVGFTTLYTSLSFYTTCEFSFLLFVSVSFGTDSYTGNLTDPPTKVFIIGFPNF